MDGCCVRVETVDGRRAIWRSDDGIATPVEMMQLLVFCVVALAFLGFVGRLHAAATQVTNTAQAAARAASQAADPESARVAAGEMAASSTLDSRCEGGAHVSMTWEPSPAGSWRGGSVTVELSCVVRNRALTGAWTPGVRTMVARDTQPVDRYQQ
ncbi:MAG: hypothetical protein Q8M22_08750 [Actinomycetota bacterium]|nr:hypothetical protein [Actinomycetota bacterium]